jgi:hypothetical protein
VGEAMMRYALAAAIAVGLLLCPSSSYAQDGAAISWRVIDRFRLFAAPDDNQAGPSGAVGQSDRLMADVYRAYESANGARDWSAEHWQAFAQTARLAAFFAAGRGDPENQTADEIRRAHDQARRSARFFWWNRRTDSYDPTYLRPDRYWIEASVQGFGGDALCTWRILESGDALERTAPCAGAVLPIAARWLTDEERAGLHHARIVAVTPMGIAHETNVDIVDRLIVAIGDSVASGEGNPDIASDWAGLDDPDVLSRLVDSGGASGAGWFMTRAAVENVAGAVWFDEQCHRSLNSWQARAAMALATEQPHHAVTFVSFACGGASAYDGILYPQESPPGGERFVFADGDEVRSVPEDNAYEAVLEVSRRGRAPRLPQIDAVARLICDEIAPREIEVFRKVEEEGSWDGTPYDGVACRHRVREIDRLLVTLGGNDVGFAEAIVWSIVPRGSRNPVEGILYRLANNGMEGRKCARWLENDPGCTHAAQADRYAQNGQCTETENDRVPQGRPTGQYLVMCFLPRALDDVSDAVEEILGVAPERQAWNAYPPAFWQGYVREEEQIEAQTLAERLPDNRILEFPNYSWLCGRDETLPSRVVANGEEDSRSLLALYGGADGAGRLPVASWVIQQFQAPDLGFRIMRWETNETATYLYGPLVRRLRTELGDRLVPYPFGVPDVPDVEADTRGWCATTPGGGPAAEGVFPRLRSIRGHARWTQDYEPWDWEAYALSPRLTRSPSDSALTQFPGPWRANNEIGLFDMANMFGDAVAGMMHPNAQAHALLANAAMDRLRQPVADRPR